MVQAAFRDVKLSDRAMSRTEAARDLQKANKPHDIRNMIPKVAWTDPAAFPPHVFREYPKMALLDGNLPIKVNEVGDLLVFYDVHDEEEFKANNPELAEEIERNEPAKQLASAIAAKDTEIGELRARLKAAGLDDPAPKTRSATAGLVREHAGVQARPPEDKEPGEASGDLRETLRQAGGNSPASPVSNPLKAKKKAAVG